MYNWGFHVHPYQTTFSRVSIGNVQLNCAQFIHGKFIQYGQDLSGYRVVASSPNLDEALNSSAQQAVYLGASKRHIDFNGAFVLGQIETVNDVKSVFTRFLWGDQVTSRGVVLHKHHLLLTPNEFQGLGYNFRPLINYFRTLYPHDVIPSYHQFEILPDQVTIQVSSEPERLEQLWNELQQSKLYFDVLTNLFLALFESTPIMVQNFRTGDLKADEELALNVTELLILLLPKSLRPHLTFATQLFEPERSLVRLKFDSSGAHDLRIDWATGKILYPGMIRISNLSGYIKEIISLLQKGEFGYLAQHISQVQLEDGVQLGQPDQAMKIYLVWEPITEDKFLDERIEENRVSLSRWLSLLQEYLGRKRRLQPQQLAKGLACLTRMMIHKKNPEYQQHPRGSGFLLDEDLIGFKNMSDLEQLVPELIAEADGMVYKAETVKSLSDAPQFGASLFVDWLKHQTFRGKLACRELTCDLIVALTQQPNGIQQAMNFITEIWPIFPTNVKKPREALLETCAKYAKDVNTTSQL